MTTRSPSRVGGADDPLASADNPVAVVGGKLCIPGPSLKGAYRNEVERWLIAAFRKDGKWADEGCMPCIPAPKPSKDEEALASNGTFRKGACAYSDSGGTICPACYLLGAQGLVGFVSVPFLFSDAPRGELYSSRLDRVTQTVAKGTNRPYQLNPQDSVFTGELRLLLRDDVLGWEFGKPRPLRNREADRWLEKLRDMDQEKLVNALVVERLKAIQVIGGYKSKGFGRVSMEVKDIQTQ